MRSVFVSALVLVALGGPAQLRAQDAGLSPTEWLARAEDAEDHADPAAALDAWRQLIATAPTSRLAGRARARIGWIEERAEGDYAPLRAMMTFLALAPADRDASVVTDFAGVVVAMPDGRVRPESRLAVAGEWARLGDTERAHAAWQAALDDPQLEPSERALVQESMARARMDGGDVQGAIDELEDADLGALSLHQMAQRRLRIARWVPVAYALIAAFALAVLVLVARSGRAREIVATLRDAPLRPVIAAVLGFGPYAIVWWWGDESADAFRAFAPCSFAIVLLSFLAGEATEVPAIRLGVGALAMAAALAAAFVSVALYGEALPFA